ncbi:MAG: cytochrome-c peroxidase [Gemmatimonadetes bacterium]|nr:cytochrome-c peroxidase [Gemmatimonadota bacterium]
MREAILGGAAPASRPQERWRRRTVALIQALALAAACTGDRPQAAPPSPTASTIPQAVSAQWVAGIDSLHAALETLAASLNSPVGVPSDSAWARPRALFRAARHAYKRGEYLSTYYFPTTSRAINGPPLPRVEDEEGPEAVFPPEGFQVVEALLFAPPDDRPVDSVRATARHEVTNLQAHVRRLRTAAAAQLITEDRLFDAAKVGVGRLVSLGITGFDAAESGDGVAEGVAVLEGIHDALRLYEPWVAPALRDSVERILSDAQRALREASGFDAFDRLEFITAHANPVARVLAAVRDARAVGVPQERRGWRVSAVTLFDSGAFDPAAFAAPDATQESAAQVALGAALFRDPRLSDGGDRSCASCHHPERAFTDGLARSAARAGVRGVLRNAPTVINSGVQVGSFADLRATYLEDQVTDVLGNPAEMHGSPDRAAARLGRDSAMARRFHEAYPGDSGVTGASLRRALAAYLRALTHLDSRVDRALRGAPGLLDPEERLGFNLFAGKGKCATCHFLPLTNGTVPPMFAESEVEVIGVPAVAVTRGARLDGDLGRYLVTRAEPHRHAFRTPSVRNVALTAPYMHNGVFRTLAEVVDFYNRGGGAGIGARVPNQTLPFSSLELDAREQRALVRFMEALTDTSGTAGR